MQLPLFPLPLVLLPHAPLTLNVFEPRYRAMVAQCLMHQQPFGVVLVQAAAAHSGSADDIIQMQQFLASFPTAADEYPAYLPHRVATIATIQDHVVFDDGRFGLQCVGGERVQIVGLTQRLPYLVATVTPIPDDVTPATKAAAMALHEVYARYWRAVQRTSATPVVVEPLPSDEVAMSWHLAQRIQVDNDRKQELLTMSTTQRLRSMIVSLRAEARTLPLTTPGASRRAMELELMVVAVGTASLYLPSIFSLKEKRSLVKSLIERIKARYNVSVAEVGDHDVHGRTQIGVAAVSTRGDHAQHQIEAVFRFIEETRPDVVWIDSDIELL